MEEFWARSMAFQFGVLLGQGEWHVKTQCTHSLGSMTNSTEVKKDNSSTLNSLGKKGLSIAPLSERAATLMGSGALLSLPVIPCHFSKQSFLPRNINKKKIKNCADNTGWNCLLLSFCTFYQKEVVLEVVVVAVVDFPVIGSTFFYIYRNTSLCPLQTPSHFSQ